MSETKIVNKEHYAYVTRMIVDLYNDRRLTNVTNVVVEPDYGYVTQLTYIDGSTRITYGNDIGLNSGAACELAKDKGHSKFLLRSVGINCPEGREFLLPWRAARISPRQLQHNHTDMITTSEAFGYVDSELGYPVYVKSVDGSKGSGVFKVTSELELHDVFEEYERKKVAVAMVEKPVDMPDYRLVILDGELISAYQRIPLTIVGDGTATIAELLLQRQRVFDTSGRDTLLNLDDVRIAMRLQEFGLNLDSVLRAGEPYVVMPISNLSAGGDSIDYTGKVADRWVKLAMQIGKVFHLRILGLDLACEDITNGDSDYCVFEVNAAPGLDHYASSGDKQKQIVADLYTKVLNAFPGT